MTDAKMVAELVDKVGVTLVAYMAESHSRAPVYAWSNGLDPVPHDAFMRLSLASMALGVVAANEGWGIARAWLVGMNPRLDDESPAQHIRDLDYRGVAAAVQPSITGEEMGA